MQNSICISVMQNPIMMRLYLLFFDSFSYSRILTIGLLYSVNRQFNSLRNYYVAEYGKPFSQNKPLRDLDKTFFILNIYPHRILYLFHQFVLKPLKILHFCKCLRKIEYLLFAKTAFHTRIRTTRVHQHFA